MAEIAEVIEGPFESTRTHESWCWDRPNGAGGLHYSRPDILLRCARIFGGSVKVFRTVEQSTTTVHAVLPSTRWQARHVESGATAPCRDQAEAEAHVRESVSGPWVAELVIQPGTCRECNSNPEGCRRSRIKCCPDCTHTSDDLRTPPAGGAR